MRRSVWFWSVVSCGAALVAAFAAPVAAINTSQTARTTSALPLPPLPKSPVEQFRELLAMTPAERRAFLANRSLESQKLVLAKIREYESLKPEQRELRLRVTELRWYLMPLMSIPATNRADQLARLSPDDRKLVEDRLNEWDKLPPEIQKELLDNEAAIRYFSELESDTDENRRKILDGLSPARREKLEAGIAQWRALPEQQRYTITTRFNQFFDLTVEEKSKALSTLSDAERKQIEKTLKAYSTLPPAQREQCLRSLDKFTRMSLHERQQFLKNADRWKLMSPSERQSWRDLVNHLGALPPLPWDVPPLPPGPGLHPRPPHPALATNPSTQRTPAGN